MTITMWDASVPVFTQMLKSLDAVLEKSMAHAVQRKFDPAVLFAARLYPDMLPLSRQVQIASDFAKGAPARLAGIEPPKFTDDETSMEGLRARIAKTLAYAGTLKPEQFAGAEERDITLQIGGAPVTFKGQAYLLHFALPNFFFHVTTAYALLRHNGIEIGKRDFIGSF